MKYLIAEYRKGYCVNLFDNVEECCKKSGKTKQSIFSRLTRSKQGKYKSGLFYIDLSVHSDIFQEEDEIFYNEFVKPTLKKTDKEIAKELGISIRTYYRHKSKSRREQNGI